MASRSSGLGASCGLALSRATGTGASDRNRAIGAGLTCDVGAIESGGGATGACAGGAGIGTGSAAAAAPEACGRDAAWNAARTEARSAAGRVGVTVAVAGVGRKGVCAGATVLVSGGAGGAGAVCGASGVTAAPGDGSPWLVGRCRSTGASVTVEATERAASGAAACAGVSAARAGERRSRTGTGWGRGSPACRWVRRTGTGPCVVNRCSVSVGCRDGGASAGARVRSGRGGWVGAGVCSTRAGCGVTEGGGCGVDTAAAAVATTGAALPGRTPLSERGTGAVSSLALRAAGRASACSWAVG